MRKRIIKWILIFSFSLTALFVVYELFLKGAINDYQISLIEKRLVKNFERHADEMLELTTFVKQFKSFEMIVPSNDIFYLTIENSDPQSSDELIWINIQDNSISLAGYYDLKPADIEQMITNSTIFDSLDVCNWKIHYSGKTNTSMVKMLLNNQGIGKDDYDYILNMLESANCVGVRKTEDKIIIRFLGHDFDSFNYVFPLNAKEITDLHHLTGNFYWEHHESGLFCG
ncbi:MAG: hypothetical protein AAFX87_03640 [Bacteroidota bacterium]